MKIYNSALTGFHNKIDFKEKVTSFTHDLGFGFVHDVVEGIPGSYKLCDALYFENFWNNGHKTLKVKYSFADLQNCINNAVNTYEGKVYLVTGKSVLKHFTGYNMISPIMLHNYESVLLQWNSEMQFKSTQSNYDVISKVVSENDRIGDIMCGYGNTVMECLKQNKKFICSDISPECISITNQQIKNHEREFK